MYSSIMVPLDGPSQTERALPFAVRVARETAGRLVLVRTPSGRDPLAVRSAATSMIAAVFSEVVRKGCTLTRRLRAVGVAVMPFL